MKRLLGALLILSSTLLAGCAAIIASDVTAFHDWPANLQDKSFVFAPTKEQEGSLEYRNYQQLIRAQLLRLGFSEAATTTATATTAATAATAAPAALNISFSYSVQTGVVVVTEPVYGPFWHGPAGWHGHPPGLWPAPLYDPFWGPPRRTSSFPSFQRRLHLTIARADGGQKLYEVSVDSEGHQASLSLAMPYMVRSAFSDFPGPSGVSRHIRLKRDQPRAY